MEQLDMSNEKMHGEGNHEADRRYRRRLRKTVDQTTEEERAIRARSLSGKEKAKARKAEAAAKRRARTDAQEK
jgi:hypothetical protein